MSCPSSYVSSDALTSGLSDFRSHPLSGVPRGLPGCGQATHRPRSGPGGLVREESPGFPLSCPWIPFFTISVRTAATGNFANDTGCCELADREYTWDSPGPSADSQVLRGWFSELKPGMAASQNLRMLLRFSLHLASLWTEALPSLLLFRWSHFCCKTAPADLIRRHASRKGSLFICPAFPSWCRMACRWRLVTRAVALIFLLGWTSLF